MAVDDIQRMEKHLEPALKIQELATRNERVLFFVEEIDGKRLLFRS